MPLVTRDGTLIGPNARSLEHASDWNRGRMVGFGIPNSTVHASERHAVLDAASNGPRRPPRSVILGSKNSSGILCVSWAVLRVRADARPAPGVLSRQQYQMVRRGRV